MKRSALLSCAVLVLSSCVRDDTDTDPDTDIDPDTDTDTEIDTTPDPVWFASGGGAADDEWVSAIADAGDGTLIAVGVVDDAAVFTGGDGSSESLPSSGGGRDMFVARLDAATGAIRSVTGIGGTGEDVAWSVAGDGAGGFYLLGASTGDLVLGPASDPLTLPLVGASHVVLAAFDADDSRRFAIQIGESAGPYQPTVVTTADGGALFAVKSQAGTVVAPGTDQESFPANAGDEDILVGRVDRDGVIGWVRTYGGPGAEAMANVVEIGDGYLLGGGFSGAVDFGGVELTEASAFGDSGFVARFREDGTGVWATALPSGLLSTVNRLALTDDGGVVAAGYYLEDVTFDPGGPAESTRPGYGDVDGFIARFAVSDGGLDWGHTAGTESGPDFPIVTSVPGGGVVLLGNLNERSGVGRFACDWTDETFDVRGDQTWLTVFDAAGEATAFALYPGSNGRSAAALSDGDLVVAGDYWSGAVFGAESANELAPTSIDDGMDAYVLRLDLP